MHQKAAVGSTLDYLIDALGRVFTLEVGKALVEFSQMLKRRRSAEKIPLTVPANLLVNALVLCNQAQMAGAAIAVGRFAVALRDFDFVALKRQKILIAKVAVVEHKVVVGIRYDRITICLVQILYFLRRASAVRYGCVAMQISLVIVSVLRQ
jgi:hypothetical protein